MVARLAAETIAESSHSAHAWAHAPVLLLNEARRYMLGVWVTDYGLHLTADALGRAIALSRFF